MNRREIILPSNAISTLAALDASAGHTAPAGLAMGISPESVNPLSVHLPDRYFRNLPDGTSLLALDNAITRSSLSSLPPGSIIDLLDAPSMTRIHPAVLIKHSSDSVEFIVAQKIDGLWDTYEIDGVRHSEADDVRLSLANFFSLDKGAEGTQMLGAVFNSGVLNSQTALSEIGHSAHEDPEHAVNRNLVIGNAFISSLRVMLVPEENSDRRYFARIKRLDKGIAPLRMVGVSDSEGLRVLNNAFISRASDLAAVNPSGYGAGTSAETVLDTMIDSLSEVAEAVGSGITVGVARQNFYNRLSCIPKSF